MPAPHLDGGALFMVVHGDHAQVFGRCFCASPAVGGTRLPERVDGGAHEPRGKLRRTAIREPAADLSTSRGPAVASTATANRGGQALSFPAAAPGGPRSASRAGTARRWHWVRGPRES